MSDDHGHDHGADGAQAHAELKIHVAPNPYGQRVKAMEALLIEKGVLTHEDVQRQIDYIESRSPADGARVVARAWVDPAYKARLMEDPKPAFAEVGIDASGLVEFVVVENTDAVHHVVVCTLCSCYPRPVLGRPPDWYKSLSYRSRAVIEPRVVMREFGTEVPPNVEVQVHDSTADIRYLVLPQRPPGTEGWSEEQLATLVTRDSMIGVTRALEPSAAPVSA